MNENREGVNECSNLHLLLRVIGVTYRYCVHDCRSVMNSISLSILNWITRIYNRIRYWFN